MIKPLVSFYIGGMGVYYHALFCRYGFEENADLVREPVQRRRSQAGGGRGERRADRRDRHLRTAGALPRAARRVARRTASGSALMNLPTGAPFELTEMLLKTMAPAA